MKWVYVGIVNDEIVAFHDKKDIMSTYLTNYKETNPTDIVSLCRMKKKQAKENLHYHNYWLVPCNETYVQTEYVDTLSMLSFDYQDKVMLIEKLNQMLSKSKRKNDKIVLIDTIQIIESNKKRCGTYTPSLRILNEEYWKYEQYRNNVYIGN